MPGVSGPPRVTNQTTARARTCARKKCRSGYLDCRERDFDALGSDEEDEDDEDAGDSRHDYEPGSACEKLHELVKHMQDAPKEIRSSLRRAEYWAKKPNPNLDDFLFD